MHLDDAKTIDELFLIGSDYRTIKTSPESEVIDYLVVNYPHIVIKILKLKTNIPSRFDFMIINTLSVLLYGEGVYRDQKIINDCKIILEFYKNRK